MSIGRDAQTSGDRRQPNWRDYFAAAWIAVALWLALGLTLGILWVLATGDAPSDLTAWTGLVGIVIGLVLAMRRARLSGWRSWLLVIGVSIVFMVVVNSLDTLVINSTVGLVGAVVIVHGGFMVVAAWLWWSRRH